MLDQSSSGQLLPAGNVFVLTCSRLLKSSWPSWLLLGRIQENPDAGCHEEGRMPRTVECELTEDLVDTCLPGDVVTVCGIVKATNSATDAGGEWGKLALRTGLCACDQCVQQFVDSRIVLPE